MGETQRNAMDQLMRSPFVATVATGGNQARRAKRGADMVTPEMQARRRQD